MIRSKLQILVRRVTGILDNSNGGQLTTKISRSTLLQLPKTLKGAEISISFRSLHHE